MAGKWEDRGHHSGGLPIIGHVVDMITGLEERHIVPGLRRLRPAARTRTHGGMSGMKEPEPCERIGATRNFIKLGL